MFSLARCSRIELFITFFRRILTIEGTIWNGLTVSFEQRTKFSRFDREIRIQSISKERLNASIHSILLYSSFILHRQFILSILGSIFTDLSVDIQYTFPIKFSISQCRGYRFVRFSNENCQEGSIRKEIGLLGKEAIHGNSTRWTGRGCSQK